MKALGRHILAEFYGCDCSILNDHEQIKNICEEGARVAGATIISSFSHAFSPHGVSGIVVIAESHLSIHTWPEYNYAAVDIFTCGDCVNPYQAFQFLKENLKAQDVEVKEILRGNIKLASRLAERSI